MEDARASDTPQRKPLPNPSRYARRGRRGPRDAAGPGRGRIPRHVQNIPGRGKRGRGVSTPLSRSFPASGGRGSWPVRRGRRGGVGGVGRYRDGKKPPNHMMRGSRGNGHRRGRMQAIHDTAPLHHSTSLPTVAQRAPEDPEVEEVQDHTTREPTASWWGLDTDAFDDTVSKEIADKLMISTDDIAYLTEQDIANLSDFEKQHVRKVKKKYNTGGEVDTHASSTQVPSNSSTSSDLCFIGQCRALYDFSPQTDGDLGFKVGQVIRILRMDSRWWRGECEGRMGDFPSNYVECFGPTPKSLASMLDWYDDKTGEKACYADVGDLLEEPVPKATPPSPKSVAPCQSPVKSPPPLPPPSAKPSRELSTPVSLANAQGKPVRPGISRSPPAGGGGGGGRPMKRGHRRSRSDMTLTLKPMIGREFSGTACYERFTMLFNASTFFALALDELEKDSDKLALALLAISESQGQALPVIRACTKVEFEHNKERPETILRGNCTASKMMKFHCKDIGRIFVRKVFGRFLSDIVGNKKLCLEVDPSKLENAKHKEKNGKQLMEKAQAFVNLTVSEHTIEVMPREIRAIAGFVSEYADEMAPLRVTQLVGGFVMLRLINPSIATPEAYGILAEGVRPTMEARRNLVLISKLIQNLSNDVEFAKKEPFLVPFNSFIKDNREIFSGFLRNVVTDPLKDSGEAWSDMKFAPLLPVDVKKSGLKTEDLLYIAELLWKHREALTTKLENERSASNVTGPEDQMMDFLCAIQSDGSDLGELLKVPVPKSKDTDSLGPPRKGKKEKVGKNESKKKKVRCRNCGERFIIDIRKPAKKCPFCKWDGKKGKKGN